MTASNAQAIQANGKGLETYIYKTMAEFYSTAVEDGYINPDMERGKELETEARSLYELEQSVKVEEAGFIEAHEFIGCSPDGLVGKDGLIEIKCHNDEKHFRLICEGVEGIDKGYWWQMQMQMLVTGRTWCDYVAFNPNFKQTLVIHRIEADKEAHEKLLAGLEIGIKLIQEIKQKYERD